MNDSRTNQGLKFARILMVLSSISPLFILWAIRGNPLISDQYFLPACLFMILAPNAFLCWRIKTAIKLEEDQEIVVGKAEDHRDHVLVYLFAMLLPFYAAGGDNWRDLGAVVAALCFIIFLFWHLNLHYMNLIFALKNYHIFTIYPPREGNPLSGKASRVLITYRETIPDNERIIAFSLSKTVFFEVKP